MALWISYLKIALLVAMTQHSGLAEGCPKRACSMSVGPQETPPLFDGYYSIGKAFELSSAGNQDCFVDVDEVLSNFPLDQNSIIIRIVLRCKERLYFHVTRSGEGFLSDHVTYLQIEGCSTSVQDMGKFTSASNVQTLFFVNNATLSAHCDKTASCGNFSQLAALAMFNTQHPVPTFQQVFECFTNSPFVAEIMARNFSWTSIPEVIKSYFPRLQSFEFNMNKFTTPPLNFPWVEDRMRLPLNLTRSSTLQELYGKNENIDVPANLFRRTLNLDFNDIKDLSGYVFHGVLDKISIRGNGLLFVGEETFQNVSNLQALSLMNNQLEELPDKLFSDENRVNYLDLSYNRLSELSAETFQNIRYLRTLLLNHNSIETLKPHVFSSLQKLSTLNLADNRLKSITSQSLPISSVELQTLDFSSNPIVTIPVDIFYLRKLKHVQLHRTYINFNVLDEILDTLDYNELKESTAKSSSSDYGLTVTGEVTNIRDIDLANSNITRLQLTNITAERGQKLRILLKYFIFHLTGNKLMCDCSIVPIVQFVHTLLQEKAFHGSDDMFKDWLCYSPPDFRGRSIVSLNAEETYCQEDFSACPSACDCFHRYNASTRIIVDCRNRNLTSMPELIPTTGLVELWLSNNSISTLEHKDYLMSLHTLDISNNGLKNVEPGVFDKFAELKELHLNSNLIGSLPATIAQLKDASIYVMDNPFQCNCRTLWMKQWLITALNVENRSKVTCLDGQDNVLVMALAPDDVFVCTDNKLNQPQKYIVLSSAMGATLILLVLIAVLLCVFATEIKVLLFVYTGFHPFDKDVAQSHQDIDALVLHPTSVSDWVRHHVIEPLSHHQYEVKSQRDFVLGLSFHENLTVFTRRSRRMIIVLTDDVNFETQPLNIAWNIAFEKIKESNMNFIIFINCGTRLDNIKDKDIKKLIRTKSCIHSKQALFDKRLHYSVALSKPSSSKGQKYRTDIALHQRCDETPRSREYTAFLSYHDEMSVFALRELLPRLEEKGKQLCIPDRDFPLGTAIEESIRSAITCSQHTFLILSNAHARNEWCLFTFQVAYEIYLTRRYNHLVVIAAEDLVLEQLDEEIRHYLERHAFLSVSDEDIWKRLFDSMTSANKLSNSNAVQK